MNIHLLHYGIVALLTILPRCWAEEGVRSTPQAIVAGEVENPGRFELTKAATISAIFSQVTKPFAMGDTSRIRHYRNGTRRDYDAKRFGDVTVNDADIIEVPAKFIYEGQREDETNRFLCGNADRLMTQLSKLKNKLWEVRTNWREGLEGIEFRPTGKEGVNGGVSVFVRTLSPAELATTANQKEASQFKNSQAVVVICRGFRATSEFESTLLTLIRAECARTSNGQLPTDRKQESEQGGVPNDR